MPADAVEHQILSPISFISLNLALVSRVKLCVKQSSFFSGTVKALGNVFFAVFISYDMILLIVLFVFLLSVLF